MNGLYLETILQLRPCSMLVYCENYVLINFYETLDFAYLHHMSVSLHIYTNENWKGPCMPGWRDSFTNN
jgi:hypothetical protein